MTSTRETEAFMEASESAEAEAISVTDDELNAPNTKTEYPHERREIVYTADVTTGDLMSLAEASGSLDFWNAPEEDIYEETDGDAI